MLFSLLNYCLIMILKFIEENEMHLWYNVFVERLLLRWLSYVLIDKSYSGEDIMEDIKFTSINDLYKRILPALKSKVKDFKRFGIAYVKEEDVWNYLKLNTWNKTSNLLLHEMVNDILITDIHLIDNFVKTKLETQARSIVDSDTLL